MEMIVNLGESVYVFPSIGEETLELKYKIVNKKITSLAGFWFKMLKIILSAEKLLSGKGWWFDIRFSFAKS